MQLNDIKPAVGSKKTAKRVGRGHSSGWGKTCSRGQKGQKARSGGYHKVGFEGGQMPLQRRLPKIGFRSRMQKTRAEVTLPEVAKVAALHDGEVTLEHLKAISLVGAQVSKVKVILSGEIETAVNLVGIGVTKGARAAIESAGGSIK